jgi:tRNA dimethylallyltransferase
VASIRGRGRPILVAGGSGFYLRAFFAPVNDGVVVPAEVRAEVTALLAVGGPAALEAELRQRNPAGLGNLDVHNPRRLTAALERCRASGRTLAELIADFAALPGPFADCDVRLARLDRPPAELSARIETRSKAMLAAGLVDEVRRLDGGGLRRNPSAARAIGYRETLAVLDGQAPPAELAQAIARDTRALVKKQRTWFRTQLPAHPVHEVGSLRDPSQLFA